MKFKVGDKVLWISLDGSSRFVAAIVTCFGGGEYGEFDYTIQISDEVGYPVYEEELIPMLEGNDILKALCSK